MSNRGSINDSLPIVLLIDVFSRVLASPEGLYDAYYILSRGRLCRVCKGWNDIIIDYPQFWSKFFLKLPNQRITLPALDVWLQRSASIPIEIHIIDLGVKDLNRPRTEALRQYRKEMLLLLLQHLPRWKRLDVESTVALARMIQYIDFSSAQSLNEVRLHFQGCSPDTTRGILRVLEGASNLYSFEFRPDPPAVSTILENQGPSFLERLRRLDLVCSLSVSEMLEVVRRCASAKCICAKATWVNGGPITMASSKKLCVLALTVSSVDHGALAHLHLPNLKVLFVRCINEGGCDFMRAISEFICGDSGRSLQVLRLANLSIGALGGLFHTQDLRRIPIVEIYVAFLSDGTADELARLIFKNLGRWRGVDDRFRICLRPDIDMWSIGWIDSKAYRRFHTSLRGCVLDDIDVGLFV